MRYLPFVVKNRLSLSSATTASLWPVISKTKIARAAIHTQRRKWARPASKVWRHSMSRSSLLQMTTPMASSPQRIRSPHKGAIRHKNDAIYIILVSLWWDLKVEMSLWRFASKAFYSPSVLGFRSRFVLGEFCERFGADYFVVCFSNHNLNRFSQNRWHTPLVFRTAIVEHHSWHDIVFGR